MIRSGLGNQVAGVDAQAASAKTPADTRAAPAATSTEEETQSDDDAFPSLVRPHIGSLDGRKRVRVTSEPSATENNSDTTGLSVADRAKANRRTCSTNVSTSTRLAAARTSAPARGGTVSHDPARGMGRGGAGDAPADNLGTGGATQLGRLVASTDQLVLQQKRVADMGEAGENTIHKRKTTTFSLNDAPSPTTWEKCVVALLTGCGTHRGRVIDLSRSASPFTDLNYMFSDLARLASDFGINVALTNRLIWAMVQGNWTGVQAENFPPVRSVVAQAAATGLSDFKPKDM